jgi:hypothetical protein
MSPDQRAWLETMIARLAARAAARRGEGGAADATIADVLDQLIDGYRRQLAGEPPPPPLFARPPAALTPPAQLSMFEIQV